MYRNYFFTEKYPCESLNQPLLYGEVLALDSLRGRVHVDRVRATLDPVRAVSEARVKSFEARKERSRGAKVTRRDPLRIPSC